MIRILVCLSLSIVGLRGQLSDETAAAVGKLVAKALANFIAGAASGVGSEIDPRQMPGLVVVLGLNSLIFLYLAFGYGVKEWFEPES